MFFPPPVTESDRREASRDKPGPFHGAVHVGPHHGSLWARCGKRFRRGRPSDPDSTRWPRSGEPAELLAASRGSARRSAVTHLGASSMDLAMATTKSPRRPLGNVSNGAGDAIRTTASKRNDSAADDRAASDDRGSRVAARPAAHLGALGRCHQCRAVPASRPE